MKTTLVDNDVLVKGSAFRLWTLVPSNVLHALGTLGAARFVVPDAIARHRQILDKGGALASWHSLLSVVSVLEPSDEERGFAIRLEAVANQLGLPLDVGESQLCAIAVSRLDTIILTGDKRAVAAAERLRLVEVALQSLDGRVACLEQFVLRLLRFAGAEPVRGCICSEPGVDRALTICMSCSSQKAIIDDSGLLSYIESLRSEAPHLLATAF